MPRFTSSFTALLEKVAPVTPSTWTVAALLAFMPFHLLSNPCFTLLKKLGVSLLASGLIPTIFLS